MGSVSKNLHLWIKNLPKMITLLPWNGIRLSLSMNPN